MKIRHRVPTFAPRPAVLTPEYQAEVDRATAKAEKAYRDAERRLRSAEAKAQRVKERKDEPSRNAHDLQVALALVELRRQELEQLARMMKSAPASAQHRGRKGYRPVPATKGSQM